MEKEKLGKINSFFSSNKPLLVIIVILLIAVAYLVGKTGTLTLGSQYVDQQSQPTIIFSTPTPIPKINSQDSNIQQQQVQYKTTNPSITNPLPTNTPASRKKVQTTLNNQWVAGTYYCYEDGVNLLANLENQIKIANIEAANCTGLASGKAQSCVSQKCSLYDIGTQFESYNACHQSCYDESYKECKEKGNNAANLVNKLISEKNKYCP